MAYINDIKAYEILDSRGIPTLLTEVKLNNGITASASVPSGAHTYLSTWLTKSATELKYVQKV